VYRAYAVRAAAAVGRLLAQLTRFRCLSSLQ
jgi:hypothetical protein